MLRAAAFLKKAASFKKPRLFLSELLAEYLLSRLVFKIVPDLTSLRISQNSGKTLVLKVICTHLQNLLATVKLDKIALNLEKTPR